MNVNVEIPPYINGTGSTGPLKVWQRSRLFMHTWLSLFNLFIFRLNVFCFFRFFFSVAFSYGTATNSPFRSLFLLSFDYILNDILNSILSICMQAYVCVRVALIIRNFYLIRHIWKDNRVQQKKRKFYLIWLSIYSTRPIKRVYRLKSFNAHTWI